MRTSNRQSMVASPITIGAVTVLIAVVAVYLAYNANNGLPFVPTTKLTLQLENGANVFKGVEVREGGHRVGVVEDVTLTKLPDGRAGAAVRMKIDKSAGPLPRDTSFTIRMRSAVGLKYVELGRGRSARALRSGATVPVERTRLPVELDEALSTFDAPTRKGVQQTLVGLGGALAGRGGDLNATIAGLPPLLDGAESVMANLAAPETRLRRLIDEMGDFARVLAPVSATQARLFTTAADTFDALSRDPDALRAGLDRLPPTLAVGERSLRDSRPFLQRTASMSVTLAAAARELRGSLPALNQAVESGIEPTRDSVLLDRRLADFAGALETLVSDSSTIVALRALTATVTTLQPQVRFIGPHVTVCNNIPLFMTIVADVLSTADLTGSAQRGMIQFTDPQDDDIGVMGANEFAVGKGLVNPDGVPQHLHSDDFPDAIDERGNADCIAGQGGYLYSGNKNDDTPDRYYRRAVVDPFLEPEGGGPLYRMFDKEGIGVGLGPARVPRLQTFTRDPGGRAAPEPPR
jgi:virulence factor Mce-like protein